MPNLSFYHTGGSFRSLRLSVSKILFETLSNETRFAGLSFEQVRTLLRAEILRTAQNFHTCRLSGIFADVHAAVKNDLNLFCTCGCKTLRGFLPHGRELSLPPACHTTSDHVNCKIGNDQAFSLAYCVAQPCTKAVLTASQSPVPAVYCVRASTTAARQSSTAGVQLKAQVTT